MPSFKTPTQQQIDTAVQRMRSPEFAAYFFSRLENPTWVAVLKGKGLFANPPPPATEAGGGVSFPHWPASKYLARMAQHVPSAVALIFTSLDTENVSVIRDMLDAALAMPVEVAATLVPGIARATQRGLLWLYLKDASDLCVRLAERGEVPAALTLAEALFTPKLAQGQEQPHQQDTYWYKDGLKKVIPALVGREPRRVLVHLCDWLKAFVVAKKHVEPDAGSDYSWIWRPAIEEHEQNRDYDFAGLMVGFVREGFEQAIRDAQMPMENALKILDRYQYLVFKRIRVHLINEFAERNRELAQRTIMDHDLFNDYQYKHEYAMLVGHRLDLLTVEERETWFGWIEDGPDIPDHDATDEERQNRKYYWQFTKLHCVRTHLEGRQRTFYDTLFTKYGEPELADLNSRISVGWRGNDSPMTVDDLTKLMFAQAVAKVSSWAPEQRRFMGPDIEGLASTFGQYVATNPEAFSSQACALMGRPAIYVRGFIKQMAEALQTSREIDVPAVVTLCRWVLERPLAERTTPEQGPDVLVDKDWQWTRDEISQFVQNTCQVIGDRTPKYVLDGLREPLWQLVNTLCRDRAQSYIVHDISQDDPRVRDYLALGINSPRGKALEAALAYARWVANHLKQTADNHEIVPGGFKAMPEIREMLEWQMVPENRSFEAMAVLGAHLGLIYWIDKHWLSRNAKQLFGLESIEEAPLMAQGWAAWNAFLVWIKPHIAFYELFKEQFAYAVAQSAQIHLAERAHEQPMHSLGEHLMTLYGRGHLGLDDDEGLLRRFLADAHADIRRYAIGFIGRSLESDDKLPDEIVNRLQTLWNIYWASAGKKDAAEKPDAWLFGTWFASGQFPEQWGLDQLEKFVNVTPTPEPEQAIVEQLVRISQTDLIKTVRILERMVRGDREGWRIHGWLDAARQILERAMRAGGDARTQAEHVIHYLGRRGHTGFGELLHLNGITDPL